jgi:hypothetical protein
MEQVFGDGVVEHSDEVGALAVRDLVELLRDLRRVHHAPRHGRSVLQRVRPQQVHLVAHERLKHIPPGLDLCKQV